MGHDQFLRQTKHESTFTDGDNYLEMSLASHTVDCDSVLPQDLLGKSSLNYNLDSAPRRQVPAEVLEVPR